MVPVSRSSDSRCAGVSSVRWIRSAAFLYSCRCSNCGSMPSLSSAPRRKVVSTPTPSGPIPPPGCSQISPNAEASTYAVSMAEPSSKLSAHATVGLPLRGEGGDAEPQLLHGGPGQRTADLGDQADHPRVVTRLVQRPQGRPQLPPAAVAQPVQWVVLLRADRDLGQVELEQQRRTGRQGGHISTLGATQRLMHPGSSRAHG